MIKNNTKKIIGTFTTLLLPIITFAAKDVNTPINLLQNDLPGINDSANLTSYLSGAFTLAMAVGAGLAFVMISYGGIVYATADALTNKQRGRKFIEDAVIGLVILLGAYAILNTINPQLVDFNIGIAAPIVKQQEGAIVGALPTPATCPTCVAISSLSPGNPIITKDSNMMISQAMGDKLVKVADAMKNTSVAWQVNEGYTDTTAIAGGSHVAGSCHLSGTCADIVPVNRTDPGAINTLYGALSQSNFSSITYEVLPGTDVAKLKAGCSTSQGCVPPTPPLNPSITVSINSKANGPHFHVVQ